MYKIKTNSKIISKKQNDDESLKYLEKNFKKINNPSTKILFDMANIYKSFKKYDKAIKLYSKVMQSVEKDTSVYADLLYKRGGLKKYGLHFEGLNKEFPNLIYCSISGFGQTGPKSHRPGYDFMIQAMGGIMSVTGEPEGSPMKVGVGIADVMCGMYAAVSILAAIHHCEQGGKGQHIDLALLDSQAAWLINSGLNYLTSREDQHRLGNAHPNVVHYQVFQTSDSFFVLAIGNNKQFKKFCEFADASELANDTRFLTNKDRVNNRGVLAELINDLTKRFSTSHWLDGLEKFNVPCGPVNTVKDVFDDPQIKHREMEISMPHPLSGKGEVSLIGSPVKMSETPVSYRNAPPTLGQHTDEILEEILGMDENERRVLAMKKVV